MANTFTKQTLVDGKRNAVIHAYLESDGVTGELSAQTLVDASALSGSPSSIKVKKIQSSLTGFDAKLLWDATTDVPFANLPSGEMDDDWTDVGGIQNNAGSGVTGDIFITTVGFSAAGDRGHITIHVQKS